MRQHGNRTYTDAQLIETVPLARSYLDLFKRLGLKSSGSPYVRKHVERLGLDTSHFIAHYTSLLITGSDPIPDDEWISKNLVENKRVQGRIIRKRLIRHGVWEECCHICGLIEWLGEPAPLEVDHINGDHYDNRLENLRLLCANCHALTPTHAGHNKGKVVA